MKLLLVRHLWGVDLSQGYKRHIEEWREVGYVALESSPRLVPNATALREILREEGFAWIPQVFSNHQRGGGTVRQHLESLREQVEECIDAEPLFFNGQTGSDHWTPDEAEDFFSAVVEMEQAFGTSIHHETHRSRYLGNPWNTSRLLKRIPELKLTCDFSHWVCASERLLEDAFSAIAAAAARCHHLHARVGYEQGPQVPDPRDPVWTAHLSTHEHWWEMAWNAAEARGANTVTLTPEFGPPPYMHTLPFSGEPVGNLDEICDWMARRQAVHFDFWSQHRSKTPNSHSSSKGIS